MFHTPIHDLRAGGLGSRIWGDLLRLLAAETGDESGGESEQSRKGHPEIGYRRYP